MWPKNTAKKVKRMEVKQKLISQFHKNSVELVKVHLQEWRGQPYFDVRVWHSEKPGESGGENPTHKGITLNCELLPDLIKALEKAKDEMGEENNGGKS